MLKVPGAASAFRLSSGCRLELTFAMTPTKTKVAEESVRACRSWEWLATTGISVAEALSATASERVEGNLGDGPTALG
jgi:hypothetical protein